MSPEPKSGDEQESLHQRYLNTIAGAMSIPLTEIDIQTIGSDYLTAFAEASVSINPTLGSETREEREISETVLIAYEGLAGLPTKLMSPGIHAPSYFIALLRQRQSQPQIRQQYTSLMIGANTPQTINEFTTITRAIFPKADCHVLDIDGVLTRRLCESTGIATFHMGRAQTLPFGDNSLSSIQTDFLLTHLESNFQEWKYAYQEVFNEVYRALKDGGAFIAMEFPVPPGTKSGLDKSAFDIIKLGFLKDLRGLLENAGFRSTKITFNDGIGFKVRQIMDERLMSGNVINFLRTMQAPPHSDDRRKPENELLTKSNITLITAIK